MSSTGLAPDPCLPHGQTTTFNTAIPVYLANGLCGSGKTYASADQIAEGILRGERYLIAGPTVQQSRQHAEAIRAALHRLKPGGMAALLGRVSLVVLMSEFETHPLVALEAAAARRRMIVAVAGGVLEIAADGFGRGIPLDAPPEQIATAAVEELARPLPQRSPSLSSWDECAAALVDLYGAILGRTSVQGQTSKPL